MVTCTNFPSIYQVSVSWLQGKGQLISRFLLFFLKESNSSISVQIFIENQVCGYNVKQLDTLA